MDNSPYGISDEVILAGLYPNGHPYSWSVIGSMADLSAASVDDVKNFFRTYYAPDNATLSIAGDFDPIGTKQLIKRYFGAIPRGPALPARPGAAQSSFRIGSIGVPRSTRDYFALNVGQYDPRWIVHKSSEPEFARETRIHVRCAVEIRHETSAGPFTASAEIVGAKTDSGLVEFIHELNSIRDTVPVIELRRARRYLQLGMPGDFETTQQIANQLIPVALYGLPLDYYNNYVAKIEAVNQADVQRVARQYIGPSTLAIVVVGDRKNIEQELKAVNAGPILIRDFFGQPINQ